MSWTVFKHHLTPVSNTLKNVFQQTRSDIEKNVRQIWYEKNFKLRHALSLKIWSYYTGWSITH